MTTTAAPPTVAPPTEPSAPPEAPWVEPVTRGGKPGDRKKQPAPPLSPRLYLVRTVLIVVFVLAAGMVLHLVFLSSLQQRSAQQQLFDRFRGELANGTAPVGPTDIDGDVLPVGTPVAYLEIPEIDMKQVVVSGTTSSALFNGPGHRRDTVLPGESGASVIMGRSAAYGGPFAGIDDLEEDDEITVTTGLGEFTYRVIGVRKQGDPIPEPPESGESRLILTTADGTPFLPSGVVRVDAEMEGDAEIGPGRAYAADALPVAERAMEGDTSQLWALVFLLQTLVLLAAGVVWAWNRWGHAQAWIAFLPPLLLVGIAVANQVARVLPNML